MGRITRLLIIVAFGFLSCKEVLKKSVNWTNATEYEAKGYYQFLSKDNTKLFLPEGFHEITLDDYKALLDTLKVDNKTKELDFKRIEYTKQLSKNFYIFRDSISGSMLIARSMDYMPFNKEGARVIANLVKQNMQKEEQLFGIKSERQEASYIPSGNANIFKSVYKTTYPNKNEIFQNFYIISDKGKTFVFNFLVGFNANVDPYILRTKIL